IDFGAKAFLSVNLVNLRKELRRSGLFLQRSRNYLRPSLPESQISIKKTSNTHATGLTHECYSLYFIIRIFLFFSKEVFHKKYGNHIPTKGKTTK
ncbi:MAG: hypothetical protein U0L12_00080, partial [Ruminococcus sp.]|nr:hypothetical protein [Ruminococcus sp.]